jgi:hypothetical protein
MALAAGALAGSRLIRVPRVRAQDCCSNYYQQVIDAAYNEMQNDAWIIDQQGVDGFANIHWQHFLGALNSTIGFLREYGADEVMNQDQPDAAYLAWQEGGWDQFWALMTIPIAGLMSEWLGDNFNNFRTNVLGNVWIYNNGPISSQYEGIGGWAELPPWPGTFQVFGGEQNMKFDSPIDDATRETIGPPTEVPYFDVLNPYVPNLILGPLPTLIIWQSHQDKCQAMADAIRGLQALAAITVIKAKGLGDTAKIAIVIALAVLDTIKSRYCR